MTDDKPEADDRSKDLETTLCSDGRHVNVRNPRSGSGEIHTVTLSDSGEVDGCSCKGWTFNHTCYHADTVRSSPILLSSARACSGREIATDGGQSEEKSRTTVAQYVASRDKTESTGVVDLD